MASGPAVRATDQVGPPGELVRFGYTQELHRSLGFTDLLFYGLVFMVPIAPFAIFGSVYASSGGMVALAYAIGMFALVFTAASYAQMVRAFPISGSVHNYAGRGIAPAVGFLAGWAVLLDYVLVPGLLYLVAAVAMHATVPAVPVWGWLVGFVAFNTTVNYLGIRMAALVTKLFLLAELLVLAVFLAVGVWALAHGKGRGLSLDAFYNGHTFTWPLVFGAVSVAVLSFLGFDGISMLAEENRGGARQIGRAMAAALLVAGLLFIVQTWVASMLVTDPASLIAHGDPDGVAFYDAAASAGGAWLGNLTAVATAIAWGIADALVAQVATSRLLYAMARDRQLPPILARVSVRYGVPSNAITLVALLSLGLGLYMASRPDGIGLLVSMINFGALAAFLTLHVAVIWHYVVRGRSRQWWPHLVMPAIGFAILGYVMVNAQSTAREVGLSWIGLGVVVLVVLHLARRKPVLAGMSETEER